MTPIEENYCSLHTTYAAWQHEKWIEQDRKNESLFSMCTRLTQELTSIRIYLAKITAVLITAMTIVQFCAPIFWRYMGVK